MKKITLFFVLMMMSAAAFTAAAGNNMRGDCNQDGGVNIADVTCLINHLLSGRWPEAAHEWVDLGLPSGTLWATCNVGASSPEEYGDYFAWGETEPKEFYGWETYKWCNGTLSSLTKYSDYSAYGIEDNKLELDPEDDAAYVNWGPSWRTPIKGQIYELLDYCSWQWTTRNGVNGQLAIGPNGKTVFFPAAGFISENDFYYVGRCCYYWARSLAEYGPYAARYLYLDSEYVDWGNNTRERGLSVRPVRATQE